MAVKLEYDVGPLKINLRVLLESKGFLRIILAFIAILAFSITAGFNSSGSNNTLTCAGDSPTQTNYTVTITYAYPYDTGNLRLMFSPNDEFISNRSVVGGACDQTTVFTRQTFSGSSEYYVAMGVFTMLYVLGAILIYMFFINPDLFMAKYLVIADLFFTIGFGVFYVLACIAWSAGVAQLNSYVADRLRFWAGTCFECRDIGFGSLESFAQPAISLLFGWLASFIWFASIWFVYKDTYWHNDRTGPLAKLYQVTSQEGQGGSQERDSQRTEGQ